jgi:hypothetical protein
MSNEITKLDANNLLPGDSGEYVIKNETLEELDPLRAEILQDALIDMAKDRGLELSVDEDIDRNTTIIRWQPKPKPTPFETLVENILKTRNGKFVIHKDSIAANGMTHEETLEIFKRISVGEKLKITVKDTLAQSDVLEVVWSPSVSQVIEHEKESETNFVEDLIQHMSVVAAGEVQAEKALVFVGDVGSIADMMEAFKDSSRMQHSWIRVKEADDPLYVHVSWGPLAGMPPDGIVPTAS